MLEPKEFLTRQQSVYSKTLLGVKDDSSEDVTRQLLAHVPNSLIYFDYKKDMPATKEFLGVVLFADISGFTKLTECYSTLETSDGTSGIDKLQHTLNAYIGKIVEEIIQRNGDVLKFAGDAILATWKCSDIGHDAKAILNKVINCSIDIQKKCHNFLTEVGIVLCVKLAVAVGPMCLTYVGLPSDKQFDLSGTAVDDVGLTEKQATPGAIILSELAWANCDQNLFDVTPMVEGKFFKIIGHSQVGGKNLVDNRGGAGNKAGTILQQVERSVRSPLDYLVDHVVDYTQDMPKALLMADDDVKEANDYFLTQTVIGVGKPGTEKNKKKMKFDRQTMTSNLKSSEIENLRAYVAKPVLDKLDNGQNLDWLSEMRQVSVLFINMKLPDLAHAASEALQKAFEVVHESCTKFKGNLNKLFGFDKGCTFVVIFGLPGQKKEDDPVRALKCALSIFDSLHSVQEIVNESIGVTTGLAFTGVIGHTDRHEYTVIGSKVNMAARLMMFYPGLLTCDADTYEASASRLRKQDFIEQPYIELKGMKDPGVVREYNPNSSKKEEEDDFNFPILGRKKELSLIHNLFDAHDNERHIVAKTTNNKIRNLFDAHDHDRHTVVKTTNKKIRKSQIVVIEGDAGIGKTRLLEQVMDDAERRLYRVIHVEGDLAQVDMSGHISNTIIKMFFDQGVGGGIGVLEKEAMITLLKKSGDLELIENLHLIKDVLQISGSSHHMLPEASDTDLHNKRRMLILKVLKILTIQQTCLLVIDNARYVDEKSWAFLRDLFKETSSILLLSVRSRASNLSAPALELMQQRAILKIPLPGLEKEDIVDLICQLLQVSEVPKTLCELIYRKSQGFPSWCEQLIKDAIYANTIQIIAKPSGTAAISMEFPLVDSPDVNVTPLGNPSTIQSRQGSVSTDHAPGGAKPPKFDVFKSLIGGHKIEEKFVYVEHDYISATEGVVPEESDEICIITPGGDLNSILQPDSVKDMVLARMDRMTLNEQIVLKCASVLGQSFTRDLLKAIIPKNCANMLDATLYNLCKQQFFECGSLQLQSSQHRNQSSHQFMSIENKVTQPHHHHHHLSIHNLQVSCACYLHEGFPVINLSQVNTYADGKKRVCLYFHFSNSFVQEAAYALWLEDQRKSLIEKAALYLERYSDKCRACGGNGFIPGHGRGLSPPELMKCGSGRKFSISASTATMEQTKIGRSLSEFGRKSTGCSAIISQGGGGTHGKNYSVDIIQEEASRVFKNCKSEHIKNYTVCGTQGESIGLLLVEMARVLAYTKMIENGEYPVQRSRFGKITEREHPSAKTISKLTTRALMTEFRMKTSLGHTQQEMSRKKHSVSDGCEIDLSQCQCAELHANILPQLVYYWRMAGNQMKCFQYMIDATAAFIDVNDTMKTFSFLRDIDQMMEKELEHNNNTMSADSFSSFVITEEEKAKIECLKGQAMCNMGCYKEGITHFHNALNLLKSPQPTTKFGLITRMWKAYLVQLLHLKMPDVFHENKRDFSMDVMHCLSFLSKAYTIQKEYDMAYLVNLEQLNLAEEGSTRYWNELINAYSDMIVSCHILRKFETGKRYERLAIELTKSASLNVDDTVSMGKLYFTLVSFHLANQDVNSALESAMQCHKLARSINDLNLKLSILPFLVQINLFKGRFQACTDVMCEYKQLLQGLDDEEVTLVYYNCCMDQLLDTGDTSEELSEITRFLSTKKASGGNLFVAKLSISVALWYARQESRFLVPQFHAFNEIPDDELEDVEVYNEVFKVRFNLHRLECSLHQYRCQKITPTPTAAVTSTSNEIKVKTTVSFNRVQDAVKRYGLFQARFIHYQAYYAFLRKKCNRAKLLLEDCRVASKNLDGGYDLEWCQASLRTWSNDDEDVERFISGGGVSVVKYVLPDFKQK